MDYQDKFEMKSRILDHLLITLGHNIVSCVIPDETIPQLLEDRIVPVYGC